MKSYTYAYNWLVGIKHPSPDMKVAFVYDEHDWFIQLLTGKTQLTAGEKMDIWLSNGSFRRAPPRPTTPQFGVAELTLGRISVLDS
jgi:hypothetical protein